MCLLSSDKVVIRIHVTNPRPTNPANMIKKVIMSSLNLYKALATRKTIIAKTIMTVFTFNPPP